MPIHELLGASVEIAAADFEVADPLVDVWRAQGMEHLIADRDHAILWIAGIGTFAIARGGRIRFEPEPGAPESALTGWLHGPVATLLLAQRRWFALHASVVEVNGCGVAVAGRAGAGKSTTALRLAQRGHTLVTDDVSPLSRQDAVTVHPFTRPVHVWPDAAAAIGLELDGARPAAPASLKLALPVASAGPLPVRTVAVLGPHETAVTVDTAQLQGMQAHTAVHENIFSAPMLTRLYRAEMFAWAASVAAGLSVHIVARPSVGWTVDAVADAVEQLAAAES
jgi:hypothetical protein